jgi:4-hydroxyphenylpyruvate dioxygenase
LSSPLHPDHAIAQSVLKHGDSVAIIALEVPDVEKAFWETTSRGAKEAIALTEEQDEQGVFRYAAIHVYGDTLIKFVERSQYPGFAPGFAPSFAMRQSTNRAAGVGLTAIDHVVANVEYGAMDRWVQFFADVMGFELLMHFDDQAISTEYSALMSKVMRDRTGKIKLPINEPAYGKRKSQIDEFLEYHHGPGIQHIALATDNIIETVTQLKRSGVEFLQTPATYYQDLASRVGPLEEPIDQLAKLGILIDRDSEGYLLQIFTQPVQDRPTLFFEIIQRHGAQGFGEGNFKALFEAIEREQALRGNL